MTNIGDKFVKTETNTDPIGQFNCNRQLILYNLQTITHILTNFEIIGWKCRTCKETREDHEDGYRDSPAHITISYLYVLYLCGCKKYRSVFIQQISALEKVFKFKGNSINTCTLYTTSCEKKTLGSNVLLKKIISFLGAGVADW